MPAKSQGRFVAAVASLKGDVAAMLLTGAPMAMAQSGGMVSVDISNVAESIARNINADVSQIPATVQVPVGIAAAVCGVTATKLGSQATSGNAQCEAKATSPALNETVQRQLKGSAQG